MFVYLDFFIKTDKKPAALAERVAMPKAIPGGLLAT